MKLALYKYAIIIIIKYINFDFISYVLCGICITELFVLCVLYFVINDRVKMFNHIK